MRCTSVRNAWYVRAHDSGVWLAWRYIERGGVAVSAALGLATATAFLFRHDHGLYMGGVSLLAFVLEALVARPRNPRAMVAHAAAYAAVALVVVDVQRRAGSGADGAVQGHRAEGEIAPGHVPPAGGRDPGGQLGLRRPGPDRLAQVAVGRGVAGHPVRDRGQHPLQAQVVDRAERCPARE